MRFKLKRRIMKIFLEILYIAYISSFPTPNAADSIPGGLLVKKSTEKCPRTLQTIKYELTCALRGASSQAGDRRRTPPPSLLSDSGRFGEKKSEESKIRYKIFRTRNFRFFRNCSGDDWASSCGWMKAASDWTCWHGWWDIRVSPGGVLVCLRVLRT